MRAAFAFALQAAATAAFLLFGGPASPAAERRLVVAEGADYFGRDFDVLRDVDLEACKAACVRQDQCQAFTYNTEAGWCFLKSEVGELRAVDGAVSGRIVAAAEVRPDVEAERTAELGFLPREYLDEARRVASIIEGAELPSGAADELAAEASGALASGNTDGAANGFRAALRLAPDRTDLWMGLLEAVSGRSEDWQTEERLKADRMAAAVNAFLHAVTDEERAEALASLGLVLDGREAWKPAIAAHRASLAIRPSASAQAALDKVVAEHGFRIVEHRIDSDAASPRICLVFSDALASRRGDIADFVRVEGGETLPVEAEGNQVCVDGVEHGSRYRVTARAGLPAEDGEALAKTATLDLYVRDRAPSLRFSGNAYVLPAGGEATVPVVSVNTDTISAELVRIGDRQLARAIGDGQFLRQLSSYETDEIKARTGEPVWTGTVEVKRETNREVTTAIPVGELVRELQPGVYVLSARPVNEMRDEGPRATQWFVVSDIGLTTLSGSDGLHVFARSLSKAAPQGAVALRLVALNNEVLGQAETDAAGHAVFAPGLARGTGGNAPALLAAETASGDYVFLDMTKPAVDLADRGVEGRPAPGPVDVFARTERGIYRVGETVYFTALVRDAKADALPGLPLVAAVLRPDGVEHARLTLQDQGFGSLYAPIALPENGMRGAWRVNLYTDPKDRPVAETTFLVEDFQPERLDFDLETIAAALDPVAPTTVTLDARFLYGAPAGGLTIEGETVVAAADTLDAYPGYRFGLASETFETVREQFASAETDEAGSATLTIAAPPLPPVSRPLTASVAVRVIDSSGRPVERTLTLPVASIAPRIGVKPLFEGAVDQNSSAGFEVIAVDAGGRRIAADGLAWTLNKVETEFQWYRTEYGGWSYETTTSRARVGSGTVNVTADAPARVSVPVAWGGYELELHDPAGRALPTSVAFEAGWYVAPKSLETPDVLKVSLDKPRYRVGETAVVHIEPRFAGQAEILVLDDRVIARKSVTVGTSGADVPVEVTRDWGPGAYVTAILYRPMDLAAKTMPGRAIGLSWAGVEPGDRLLQVSLDVAAEMRPRQAMSVGLDIPNLAPGDEAYVTLAAVDLGILNLTGYETPKPEDWYFGQRRLGMELRDFYNQLIDRMQGVRGAVRSGGDAPGARFTGPPPTERLVALHSGIVRVGPDGRALVTFDVPDFNGTLRLMAMAWSRTGVGHAERDVLVRDPVVMAASLPAFLAPGDASRLSLDLAHTSGPAGDVSVTVATANGRVAVEGAALSRVALASGERKQLLVPLRALSVGDERVEVALTLPDGEVLTKALALPVRVNEPEVAKRSYISLAPTGTMSLSADALAEFLPGTGVATLSATGAGRLDVAGIVRALDRYPYGCTEQIASRALPLVYLDEVTLAAGLSGDPAVRARVGEAIAGVLANQASNGGFGLWSPASNDLWLDAYVSDFLSRAKGAGFAVPEEPFSLALDNLKNRVAYAEDFESGGEDVAYALYVLARNGRAAIGDLRYYAETRLDRFATPLAKAQIGAALALYGDKPRAEAVFRRAVSSLDMRQKGEWRLDYGSPLRDAAAVLTLASETRTDGADIDRLALRVQAERASLRHTSTQEDAWSLLAAKSLMQDAARPRVALNGTLAEGPLYRRFARADLEGAPVTFANFGDRPLDVAVTLTGVPVVPEPASGSGYAIARAYYTLEGEPADPATIAQGDRLVAVLTVSSTREAAARLLVNDPLPAGFEIDSPTLLRGGDVATLDWLDPVTEAAHVEFRADRFVAALDRTQGATADFQFAYIVRAVSPGSFAHPAAVVEDMYQPEFRARTDSGRVEVIGATR